MSNVRRPTNMSRSRIATLSAAWGLGMFLFFWFVAEPRPSIAFATVVFLLCMVGGAAWGGAMLGFLWLAARYAGTHRKPVVKGPATHAQRELHFASLAFTAAPLLYGTLVNFEQLWPSIAAGVGPALTMLPLSTRTVTRFMFWSRCVLGFLLGLVGAIAVHWLASSGGNMPVPSAQAWFVALLCSASWSVSYVLSFKARGV